MHTNKKELSLVAIELVTTDGFWGSIPLLVPKLIIMSRTIKQNKTGGKAVSHKCRNNGDCSYCNNNRQYSSLKKIYSYSLNTNQTR